MSAKSSPSAATSAGYACERDVVSATLERYLIDPPPIPESFVSSSSTANATEAIAKKTHQAKQYLDKWQASWEQKK
ncbi:hypothetical protein AUP68_06389 [Ilyonectria robusta]